MNPRNLQSYESSLKKLIAILPLLVPGNIKCKWKKN